MPALDALNVIMSRQEKLEDQMATVVPSLLVAVAIFCLTVLALETSPKHPFVDEFFGLLNQKSRGWYTSQ
jgi:hypothetical protein